MTFGPHWLEPIGLNAVSDKPPTPASQSSQPLRPAEPDTAPPRVPAAGAGGALPSTSRKDALRARAAAGTITSADARVYKVLKKGTIRAEFDR